MITIKIFIMALNIMSNHYNIESINDVPSAISYSIAAADCQMTNNFDSCRIACYQDIQWHRYSDVMEDFRCPEDFIKAYENRYDH